MPTPVVRPLSNRQHWATLWLLANGALIVLWDPWIDASPLCIFVLLWPLAIITLLLLAASWQASVARRLVAIATVVAGAVVGWQAPRLGTMFHVWWRQDHYLQRARAALAETTEPMQGVLCPLEVDRSDSPPVRVAFFWFASHGDVAGLVYDPSGRVLDGRQAWLYGARARHMFGPWYRFTN